MVQVRYEAADKLPDCSRCGGRIIVNGATPLRDSFGRPIVLELCPSCDAEKPAAGALIRWFQSGAPADPAYRAGKRDAQRFQAWQEEALAPYGYRWMMPKARGRG